MQQPRRIGAGVEWCNTEVARLCQRLQGDESDYRVQLQESGRFVQRRRNERQSGLHPTGKHD
ncbi:hypothetical protein DIPPA_01851 [Diplonema papillatum]|nr:hypothetical protein DIPPA_01851 [Diplonema papillatum]